MKWVTFAIFMLFSILNIISNKKSIDFGKRFTKPFLMPLLLLFYISSASVVNVYIVVALIFGFLGDVLLMGKAVLFLPGLISFLLGHIIYTIAFINTIDFTRVSSKFFVLLLPFIAVGIIIFSILKPYLKEMLPYALIYITMILIMSFFSLMRIVNVSGVEFILPFLGALLFLISDATLSLEQFHPKVRDMGALVMGTYLAAQCLIVLGFVL